MVPKIISVLLVFWLQIFEVVAIEPWEYTRGLNTTVNGLPCQNWNSEVSFFPGTQGNYCRDPSGSNYLWCYTLDPEYRWDLCDPRVLTGEPPYQSDLFNTTGPACIDDACCNVTWKSFENNDKCDFRLFVKLLIMHRVPEPTSVGQLDYFEKKYIAAKYFTTVATFDSASEADCAVKCFSIVACDGFIHYDNETIPYPCTWGSYNHPLARQTLFDPED